jgi:hypothetical protein
MERFNRNLTAALSIFHNSLQTTWDESLPYFTLDFNTTWHESTKQTPAKIFLGRDLLDPLDFRWKVTEVLEEPSGCSLQEVREDALSNLGRARRNVEWRYNEGRSLNPFKLGHQVLVEINPFISAVNETSAKLMLRWSEPLVIAEFLSPVAVQLVNTVTGLPVIKVHISQLKRKI